MLEGMWIKLFKLKQREKKMKIKLLVTYGKISIVIRIPEEGKN